MAITKLRKPLRRQITVKGHHLIVTLTPFNTGRVELEVRMKGRRRSPCRGARDLDQVLRECFAIEFGEQLTFKELADETPPMEG